MLHATIRARRIFVRQISSTHNLLKDAEDKLQSIPEIKQAEEIFKSGNFSQAINLLHRAVDICTSAVGKRDALSVLASKKLGDIYFYIGKYDQAELLYAKDFDDKDKNVIISTPTIFDLIRLHLTVGNFKQAQKVMEELEILPNYKNLNQDDHCLLQCCKGITKLLVGSNDSLAMQILQNTKKLSEDMNCSSLIKGQICRNIGGSFLLLSDSERNGTNSSLEAIENWEKGLEYLCSASLENEKHLKSAIECDIGYYLINKKDYKKAAEFFSSSLKSYNLITNDKDIRKARTLGGLAKVYHHLNDPVTSEGLFNGCIDIFKAKPFLSLGEMNDYLQVLEGYAFLLSKWDKRTKDCELFTLKASNIKSILQKENKRIFLSYFIV